MGTSVASDERREGKETGPTSSILGFNLQHRMVGPVPSPSLPLVPLTAFVGGQRPQVDRQVRKGKGTVPFYPPSEAWKTGQSPQASINDGGKGTVTDRLTAVNRPCLQARQKAKRPGIKRERIQPGFLSGRPQAVPGYSLSLPPGGGSPVSLSGSFGRLETVAAPGP